jgi:uncharacterized protein (TIGR03437 family)
MNRLSTWNYTVVALALTMGCFDTAMGQSFTVETPDGTPMPQITLTVPSGGLLGQIPYQVVSTTATNYTVSLSLSLNTAFPYFTLTQTGGSTPLSFDLYQQSIAPDGIYTGSLIVASTSSGTTALSVPVSVTVGGAGGGGTLTSNPAKLTFTAQTGKTAAGQFLTVTAPNSAVTAFNVGVTTQSGGNWLQVSPTTGVPTGPSKTNNVLVTVNLTGLSIGTYNGTVTLTPTGGGAPTNVPITLNVTGAPSVTFSPEQLSFAYQTGTSATGLMQTLTFSSDSTTPTSYTLLVQYVQGGAGWLVVNPLAGTVSVVTNSTIPVAVVPNGLAPGIYTAVIQVSAPGTSTPNLSVPVTLLVSSSPLLQIGTPPAPFNYQFGGTAPPPQTISLASSSTTFTYSAAVTYDAASGAARWLTVAPASGSTPAALTLTANPGGLAAGKYVATVTVTSPNVGNSPQTFQAVLNVSATTLLTTTTGSLTFNYQTGEQVPGAQQVQIASTGVPLNFTATLTASSCGGGWLSILPSTGATPAILTVSAFPGSIVAGTTCLGSITVIAPGASDSVMIPVTLNVSNKPLLNVVQNTLTFSVARGSSASAPQYISVTSTDPKTTLPYTASTLTGPGSTGWLFVANGPGTTPGNVSVTVLPGNLVPGTYSGQILITSSGGTTPYFVSVVMNVLSGINIVATPPAVNLIQAPQSSTPVTQTVQITAPSAVTGMTFNALAATATGGNWLSVSPAGGITPGSITITANANGQLSQGTYQGSVTIQMPGAANSPLMVPVTLTVGTPQTFTLTPSSVTFTGSLGGTNPAPQTVQIGASAGVANLTISTSNSTCGGNWFGVTPVSGNTPLTLTITPNLAGVPAGTCTGSITISAPGFTAQTLDVKLTTASAPVIAKVQNAGSFAFGAISPGEILYLEGANLGPDTLTQLTIDPTTHLVNTDLQGTEVLFDGQPAPLVYVSATKISVIVPYEVAGRQQTNIQVRRNGLLSTTIVQSVASTAPGLFTANASGSGQAAALNQNGTYNGLTAPAPVGTVVSIYGTGEGLVSPLPPTGSVTPLTPPYPTIVAPVTVKFGGVPLDPSDITYAGPAPTLVAGAIQINFRVPSFALPGSTPVQVVIGNGQSNSVIVVVSAAAAH